MLLITSYGGCDDLNILNLGLLYVESCIVNGWFLLNNYILNPVPLTFSGSWDGVVAPKTLKGICRGQSRCWGSRAVSEDGCAMLMALLVSQNKQPSWRKKSEKRTEHEGRGRWWGTRVSRPPCVVFHWVSCFLSDSAAGKGQEAMLLSSSDPTGFRGALAVGGFGGGSRGQRSAILGASRASTALS